MVVCPSCQFVSRDRFFCDRCNALLPYVPSPALAQEVTLPSGLVVDCSGFEGVYPADCWRYQERISGTTPYRVYALNRGWWRDLSETIEGRASISLEVLAPLEVMPIGDAGLVVARAEPGSTRPLSTSTDPEADELVRLDETLAGCLLLARALAPLHQAGYVWLNFDPSGLIVAGDRVVIQSLDLQLFPQGLCPAGLRVSSRYSPPEVYALRDEAIGPASDVFHVALHAYYRLANLLPEGFPGNGPEAFDFRFPELRIYCPGLPPGIAPVLARGLAWDPADRFSRVEDFVESLAAAIDAAHRRARSQVGVSVEEGGASSLGRVHEVGGLSNQDAWTSLRVRPDRLLAVVADGVTVARIGSGDIASQIVVEVLTRRLGPRLLDLPPLEEETPAVLEACYDATQTILNRALAGLLPGSAVDPVQVMSSTALFGIVRGNDLLLASVGDSRAYLISQGQVEQLTVDGDVRCVHLAAGLPPETIEQLGPDACALYTCLGVGEPGAGGRLVPSRKRSRPHLSTWKLLPGDVIVLCTDGLVEEGVFLDAADLARIVTRMEGVPTEAIASRLVEAARAHHRDPSDLEPEGCGDDVTCVVLRVRAAENG